MGNQPMNPNAMKSQISPQNRFGPQPGFPGQNFGPNQGNFPNMNRTMSNPNTAKPEEKKGQGFEILDQLHNLIQYHTAQNEQAKEETKVEAEESPQQEAPPILHQPSEDLGQDTIWSGFITKSKQNRVGVDAILIKGEENIL
jgi:hypothetical protein